MSGEGAHSDHISILRKDGRSFLTPGHRDKPDAAPQNYSGPWLSRWKTALTLVDTANPRVEVQRMGVPAPPPRLTVRGRCELSRTDGRPSCNDALRLWCYGEMSSRDNPQDKCLQSVRAFHLSIRIQAAPATVVGAMPTLGCLYTRWARRWVA